MADAQGLTGTSNLTQLAGAPTATGNPFALVDTARITEILLYRAATATCAACTGRPVLSVTTTSAARPDRRGQPAIRWATTSSPATRSRDARGADNHLHVLTGSASPVAYGGNLTRARSASKAAGNPSGFVNAGGVNIVAYRSVDGRSERVLVGRPERARRLVGHGGPPLAASDPVGYYTPHDDTHQIVYRGTDNQIYELYSPGVAPVAGWNLTASAGAPPAVGTPSASTTRRAMSST